MWERRQCGGRLVICTALSSVLHHLSSVLHHLHTRLLSDSFSPLCISFLSCWSAYQDHGTRRVSPWEMLAANTNAGLGLLEGCGVEEEGVYQTTAAAPLTATQQLWVPAVALKRGHTESGQESMVGN